MFDAEAVNKEIQAARRHGAHIKNGGYFNARVAELADIFKPQCVTLEERKLLREKLSESVDDRMTAQAYGARAHIALVLSGN
jgi:hypothetical protein